MERHVAIWTVENNPEARADVGELVIDGNEIEFYARNCKEVFPCAFIGFDGEHKYKVFTKGQWKNGKSRTLDNAAAYAVAYVLQQNCDFQQEMTINGIRKASFIIPELIEWLNLETVRCCATENGELFAEEIKYQPIVLHDNIPRVEIQFESESFTKYLEKNDITTFILKNQPRISISYTEVCNVNTVLKDVSTLMQFFGLMIGHVSDVEDLRLELKDQKCQGWLYVNRDFSYNLRTMGTLNRSRTTFREVGGLIQKYFESWYDFCGNETFDFIRQMYFAANNRKDAFVEDILVQYIRILEGYDLRISRDEAIAQELNETLKNAEKRIKKLIFTDDGKALFTEALGEVVPEWKYNAKHAGMIASWIARGYIEHKSLDDRIKRLDDQYLNIVSLNARSILSNDRENPPGEETSDADVTGEFVHKIVATRNYYSHYKAQSTDVLGVYQMCDTLNVLKALIITIWFSQMGMDLETIREIMIRDTELNFQTGRLRKRDEKK